MATILPIFIKLRPGRQGSKGRLFIRTFYFFNCSTKIVCQLQRYIQQKVHDGQKKQRKKQAAAIDHAGPDEPAAVAEENGR